MATVSSSIELRTFTERPNLREAWSRTIDPVRFLTDYYWLFPDSDPKDDYNPAAVIGRMLVGVMREYSPVIGNVGFSTVVAPHSDLEGDARFVHGALTRSTESNSLNPDLIALNVVSAINANLRGIDSPHSLPFPIVGIPESRTL